MEYHPGNYTSLRPGERLKKAREAQGLEAGQVSATLRILPRTLAALEADNYAALPEPVFIRGYLRLYAGLVALPADDILASFDEHYPTDLGRAPQRGLQGVPLEFLPEASTRRVPAIKWGLVGGVLLLTLAVVLGVVIWRSTVPQKLGALIHSGPSLPAPASTTISLPNTSTTLKAVDTLDLRFTGDTQVLIRDSSGKELANGPKKAGDTLIVSGESPFSIELSQADAVRFTFNNSPIDLKPYTVNGAVNFRLSR